MVANRKYAAPKEDDSSAISTRSEGSVNPAHDREIDLRQMDELDVRSLRKSDPFMYYSIPGVLKATRSHQEVDYSDITSLRRDDSHSSSTRPSGSHEHAEDDDDAGTKVSRRARVSFECPSSVIMEDIMEDFEQEEFGDLSFDLDDFVSMLGNMSTKQ